MTNPTTTTVLLVEDDPPLRMLMGRMLQNAGYKVLEATNGAAALDAIAKYRDEIALTISDVVMPHVDGFALSEQLRQIKPDARVLLVSGQADESVAIRGGLKECGLAFLLKPFTQDALAAKVNALLAGTG